MSYGRCRQTDIAFEGNNSYIGDINTENVEGAEIMTNAVKVALSQLRTARAVLAQVSCPDSISQAYVIGAIESLAKATAEIGHQDQISKKGN